MSFFVRPLVFFFIYCVQFAISESVYEVEVLEEIGEEAGIEMKGGIFIVCAQKNTIIPCIKINTSLYQS
ncbi:hypothetical protein GCM10020331_002880 [Ectobacillus funiculus]